MAMDVEALRGRIEEVRDPELARPLGSLKTVKNVRADGERLVVDVELPTPAYPGRERLAEAIRQSVAESVEPADVEVNFTAKVWGPNTGGSIGLNVKNIIAVGSGKGGVGKSTVAASLAYGLKSYGAKVGLMDADVYGPSVPHLTGATGHPMAAEHQTADGKTVQRMVPVDADGLKLISMGFFVEKDQAVIWRGPMLHRAITQFLQETDWGELDYLIIDLPPGTGDVSLTLSQLIGLTGAVVVCTPQQVALLDAIKAIAMFRKVNIPVLGLVENMSGEIFGRGGAMEKANELGIPFLGELPIEAQIRIRGDEGRISSVFDDDCPAREPLREICERTAMQIARQMLDAPKLPTLEVL